MIVKFEIKRQSEPIMPHYFVSRYINKEHMYTVLSIVKSNWNFRKVIQMMESQIPNEQFH